MENRYRSLDHHASRGWAAGLRWDTGENHAAFWL